MIENSKNKLTTNQMFFQAEKKHLLLIELREKAPCCFSKLVDDRQAFLYEIVRRSGAGR